MDQSHARVTAQNSGVIRGNTFKQFGYGKMVPIGARMPRGGAAGDDYAPYAHMKSDSAEAISAILAHGRVSHNYHIVYCSSYCLRMQTSW